MSSSARRRAQPRASRIDARQAGKPPAPRPWALLFVVITGAAVYANSLRGAFVFDDDYGIVRNATLREWWRLTQVLSPARETPLAGRPLVNLSLALNYATSGLHPPAYHLVNIAIHLTCASLVYAIVRRTFESRRLVGTFGDHASRIAFATSLIWTVHPLTSEVVDYTVQRTESMMAVCLLLTLYASLRGSGRWRWPVLAVLSCTAGMACKESMVVAPVLIVLYDAVFVFDSFGEALRTRWRFYSNLVLSWGVLAALLRSGPRATSAGFGTNVGPWTYLLNQIVMLDRYLRLAVWPHPLVLWYGPPGPVTLIALWPAGALIVAVLLVTMVALARRYPSGFIGAWIFLTLAPTSSLVPIATEVGAERRMYLPLIALVTLAVAAATRAVIAIERGAMPGPITRTSVRTAISASLLAFAVVPLGALTVARNREYRSTLGMAQTVLTRWPSGGAHYMVGWELATLGRHADALTEYRSAVDTFPRARYYLASELASSGRLSEAVDQFRLFVREQPDLAEVIPAHLKMGQAMGRQGNWRGAVDEFSRVLSMTPSNIDATRLMADGLTHLGEFEEALPYYQSYVVARPQDVGALTDFGIALSQSERHDRESVDVFQQAVTLEPRNADLRANLARALFLVNDVPAASIQARASLALNPRDPPTHDLLGRALALEGKMEDARHQFEDALRLDPTDTSARAALDTFGTLARTPCLRGWTSC